MERTLTDSMGSVSCAACEKRGRGLTKQNNRNLGGACGEIHAMISGGRKLFNPLGKAYHPRS